MSCFAAGFVNMYNSVSIASRQLNFTLLVCCELDRAAYQCPLLPHSRDRIPWLFHLAPGQDLRARYMFWCLDCPSLQGYSSPCLILQVGSIRIVLSGADWWKLFAEFLY